MDFDNEDSIKKIKNLKFLIVDIRDKEEYDKYRICNSISLPTILIN